MNNKNSFIYLAVFSLLIAFSFFAVEENDFTVFADENNVLSFVAYGAFNTGVNLTNLAEPQNFSQTVYWNYTSGRDYIYFRDSTEFPGFRVQLYLSSTDTGNFVYTGGSNSQGSIDKSNFRVFGHYQSLTPYAPTKGVDDHSKTLSINSTRSCLDAQTLSNFSFHEDLNQVGNDFSLAMSSLAQNYFYSILDCPVEGKLDIRRMELTYPPSTADGSYESQLIILIVDGTE